MLAGLTTRNNASGSGAVLVGLDGHRSAEQRDVVAGPGELVLHGDAAVHTAVAVSVVAEPAHRVEHPHARTHGDRQVPGIDVRPVRPGLGPGVTDPQRQPLR